jgi:hypothetical protein
MLTYEHNPEEFNANTAAAAAADGRLYVEFYWHYVQDKAKSEEEGRPIFRDCEFIRIMSPGDRNNIIDRELSDFDRRRFAQRYAAWKANADASQDIGTKLEEWPLVTRSKVQEYKYFGIRTVEHLAEANDAVATRLPGLQADKEKAKFWLAKTADTKAAEAMKAEKQALNERIASLEHVVQQLQGELAAGDAEEAPPKRASGKR